MASPVDKLISNRREYLKHLNEDLHKCDEIIDETRTALENLEMTNTNIQTLGKKVEHSALIPLGANIYVNANIIHTGEYLIDKLAFPDSYSVLETLDGTTKLLENKVKTQKELLAQAEANQQQIVERIELLQGQTQYHSDLPQEIVSDKGVAVKVGDFYEIVEFEN